MQAAHQTNMADWGIAFADKLFEMAEGKAAYRDLLDWAYEVWPANAHRPAAEVAEEEWANAGPQAHRQ
jgi:hypothetical protein